MESVSNKDKLISQVFNCDCMNQDIGLPSYPDNYFDLVCADPNYGINIGKSKRIGKRGKTYSTTTYKVSNWDAKIPDPLFFYELLRIGKKVIIWGGNYFANILPNSRCWFIWDKKQHENLTFAMAELAWTNLDKSVKIITIPRNLIGNCVSNNIEIAKKNAKIHHAQKHPLLYKKCFELADLKKGDTILDPGMGSQSSRIASFQLGFNYFGYEVDEKHFNDGNQRFNKECNNIEVIKGKTFKQQSLF